DTDGDGLSDWSETNTYSTDPMLADTDTDGLPDGLEVRLGFDPLSDTDPDTTVDSDNDRIPDYLELILGTDPNLADSDDDGIRDDYASLVGTDPNSADSTASFADANGDGTIDNVAAVAVLEAFLDINVLNVSNRDRLDVNRDGRVDN